MHLKRRFRTVEKYVVRAFVSAFNTPKYSIYSIWGKSDENFLQNASPTYCRLSKIVVWTRWSWSCMSDVCTMFTKTSRRVYGTVHAWCVYDVHKIIMSCMMFTKSSCHVYESLYVWCVYDVHKITTSCIRQLACLMCVRCSQNHHVVYTRACMADVYAPQTKILDDWTKTCVCVFEVLFKGVSTRFGLRKLVQKRIRSAFLDNRKFFVWEHNVRTMFTKSSCRVY